MNPALQAPALAIAIALMAGISAQAAARHVRIPGIVVLLATGVLLGPDGFGVIDPSSLGDALLTLVGFAVAVILFEGGMNLDVRRMRRQGSVIRRLITVGAIITAVGGTFLTRYLMGWDWRVAALFGTLIIVTGPTVVTPLLKRVRVEPKVGTTLEAEGLFGDAVGAVVAVVALEVALSPATESWATGLVHAGTRLGFGGMVGLVGGLLVGWLLRTRSLIPTGLENVFTLSAALMLFQLSNALLPESGLAAAVGAGMAVGNMRLSIWRSLHDFKEQLTVLLLGMLFVLLSADVRIAEVAALGAAGIGVVLLVMLVVRPLAVALATWGTPLRWQQKAFVAWIGPRGIVAAAVASFFAVELDRHGIAHGKELEALVFLLIAVSVGSAGLTGPLVARVLGLRRGKDVSWVVLGAHPLARAMAHALHTGGASAVCIDADPVNCRQAEEEGLQVLYGSSLDGRVLRRAHLDGAAGALGMSVHANENLLFCQRVRELSRETHVMVALESSGDGESARMAKRSEASVLFGAPDDIARWNVRFRRGEACLERWRCNSITAPTGAQLIEAEQHGLLLPLVVWRDHEVRPIDDLEALQQNDEVIFLVHGPRREEAHQEMVRRGWTWVTSGPKRSTRPPPSPVKPARKRSWSERVTEVLQVDGRTSTTP